MKKKVRLSQCMIVKNEEKNIRRALEWAKGIACEQIVVDTGSTDRTVEIAEKMGAKVFHYTWQEDFAAAKNYAIEQASGNWIAFLDADEYFTKEDARKLPAILEQAMTKNKMTDLPQMVRCAWIQLGDDGKAFAVSVQDRIFRNIPSIRYHGKIHEQIGLPSGRPMRCLNMQDTLSIMHTGYTKAAYEETGKSQRNIRMLRREVEENPQNWSAWSYLGDSLVTDGQQEEAVKCYEKVVEESKEGEISRERYQNAAIRLLQFAMDKPVDRKRILELAEKAGYPETKHPDVYAWIGIYDMNQENYKEAYQELKTALEYAEGYRGIDVIFTSGNLQKLYTWMTEISRKLAYPQDTVRYGVLALRTDRYMDGVLAAILSFLREEPGEEKGAEGTWNFLGKLYDVSNSRELFFLYKCAKAAGFISLEEKILSVLSDADREFLLAKPEEGGDIQYYNYVDREFFKWVSYIQNTEEETILSDIKRALDKLKEKSGRTWKAYVEYYQKFPFWGNLQPETDDYETLRRRAGMMKRQVDQFVWLYERLADYQSKRVLLAVLSNWTYLDISKLEKATEKTEQYFDLNLIFKADGEVFVDLGAYNGDTIQEFINIYGSSYRKIYAYEADIAQAKYAERNLASLHDIEIRHKGAGKEQGYYRLERGTASSAGRIARGEDISEMTEDTVEVVSLDEDICEPVSWIKMDIEGSEYDALLGCKNHIKKEQPKLSVSVYHGYEDIIRLPLLIDEINPSYRFYLRYYGGNLIPTELVLTALPEKR